MTERNDPSQEELDGAHPSQASAIQPPRAGDVLGRFVLEYPLGHGAMATVFRAHDPTLGRRVAIKVLNPAVASQSGGAERFRREAMAVAALRHPNIVEVYDFVPAAGGHSAYLIEELIVGETLQSLLQARGGALIPELAALVAAEVAEALFAAHKHGVVHRDVKPANIMIERRDQGARVVLADFGVAHVGDLTTMTATGAMVGSPAYMAPEQARGQSVGPAVDVWAMGVLLYQMATGKLPFAGRDPITVITSICKGEYRRAGQIDARVGPELDRIIVACLRPNPSDRIASAQELALQLRACAAHVGLTDPSQVVRALLDKPTQLAETLAPKLAAHAVQNARGFVRKRQLARALAELGRAVAYVPNHAEASRMIDRLSSQRKWGRVVLAAGGGALLAAAIWGGVRWSAQHKRALPAAPFNAAVTETIKPPAPISIAPAPVAAANGHTTPDAAPVLAAPKAAKRVPKKKPEVIATSLPPAEVPAPTPPPPEPAAAKPTPSETVAPLPASVRLFARFAFCFPSLDGDNSRRAPPRIYDVVQPGPHQVFCALTKEGPRVLVTTLSVKAGARLDVNIVPDATGKPIVPAGSSGAHP